MKKNFFDDDSFDFSDNGNNIQTNPDYSYNSSLGTVNEPLFNDKIEEILKQIFPSELPLEESKKEEHVQKSRNLFVSEYIPAPFQPVSNTEEIARKRGRKQKTTEGTNSTKKKTHSGWDEDNTTRKIQIHFLNFIIFYLNDIIYGYTRRKNLFLRKFNILYQFFLLIFSTFSLTFFLYFGDTFKFINSCLILLLFNVSI